MYDMVKWFINPNWKTMHLEGTNTNPSVPGYVPTKVYQSAYDTGHTLVFSKTKSGYPWDMKPYDNQWIYDGSTELDKTSWPPNGSNKNYKTNGWPMCPRYWNGDPTWYYYQASAPWKAYLNCAQIAGGDVGPVQYSLQGPFVYDFGGDIGPQQTILETYLWTAPKNREQLFLTSTYGWVQWTHATLQANGLYLLDSVSNHNLIVPGAVAPVFGCGVIP